MTSSGVSLHTKPTLTWALVAAVHALNTEGLSSINHTLFAALLIDRIVIASTDEIISIMG